MILMLIYNNLIKNLKLKMKFALIAFIGGSQALKKLSNAANCKEETTANNNLCLGKRVSNTVGEKLLENGTQAWCNRAMRG